MPAITFISADGAAQTIEAAEGLTLMENAVANGIVAIEAICGGNAYCGTCRVYIDPAWQAAMGGATDMELPMIEASGDQTPGVRLSCQITVTGQLEGLIVHTPLSQG